MGYEKPVRFKSLQPIEEFVRKPDSGKMLDDEGRDFPWQRGWLLEGLATRVLHVHRLAEIA
jgi:hypothetical protein